MNYELMLVANVDRADQLLSRVEKSLKDADAAGVRVDRLGKKQLAYSINKQKDAVYFILNFELAGESVKPIWDKLRLEQEDLLRYLILNKKEKKAKGRRGKVSQVAQVSKVSEVSQEEGEKPKVTVAVKKASTVKSEAEEVSEVPKVSKVSKGKKTTNKKSTGSMKSMKSTKSKKGKSRK